VNIQAGSVIVRERLSDPLQKSVSDHLAVSLLVLLLQSLVLLVEGVHLTAEWPRLPTFIVPNPLLYLIISVSHHQTGLVVVTEIGVDNCHPTSADRGL